MKRAEMGATTRDVVMAAMNQKVANGEYTVTVEGPTYHPKGCTCGLRSLCDGSGMLPVYAFNYLPIREGRER